MATPDRLRTILFILAVLALPAAALSGENQDQLQVMLSPALHPAAEAVFVPSLDELPVIEPPAEWYIRTGARKGLSGKADTETELFIAPDTAVLGRGLSGVWPSMLAAHQEAVVLVGPGDVAGLSSSKDLLIIPSDALANAGSSEFFKAALARYAADGGTLFCLTQRRGADFSLLPLPDGQHLEMTGWSEDSGPLFRSSLAEGNHALLKDLTRPAPLVETDGYIRAWPANADILLVRPDGFPTLIAYPFGKGRVVVGALFTDLSSLLGSPEQDEKLLLRNLLAWSKDRAAVSPAPFTAEARAPLAVRSSNSPLAASAEKLYPLRATAARKTDVVRVELELPGSAGLKDKQVLVRIAGQERAATLSRDRLLLPFDVPVTGRDRRLSYAVYGKDGRSLARGSLRVPDPDSKAQPHRPFSLPNEPQAVTFTDIGKGQITIAALGFMTDEIFSDKGTMSMDIPDNLPAGTYPVQWLFEDIQGNSMPASFPHDIVGYRVAFEEATVRISRDKAALTARAAFTIKAGQKVPGQLHVLLTGPDNSTLTVSEPVLSLVEGLNTIPVTFALDPDKAGLWELSYRFSTILSSGAGIPAEALTLDRGSVLFDTGDAAVLSISPKPLLLYEPGPVQVTALLVSKGSATVDVQLDGREVTRQPIKQSGIQQFTASLPLLAPGTHAVRVSLAGQQGTASREQKLISGLLLPDIFVRIRADHPAAPGEEPVLPLAVELGNRGKNLSAAFRLVLYDGDPAQGGSSISSIEVPALAPKGRHSVNIAWPLNGNSGVHTLVAVADGDDTMEEADKGNNRSSIKVGIPDILLVSPTPKSGFTSSEPITLPLYAFNLTRQRLEGLKLKTHVTGQGDKTLSSELLQVPEISPGIRTSLEQTLKLSSPHVGTYQFSAALSSPSATASASVRFSVLPTLLFTGSLQGTPAAAVQCRPLTIKTGVRSAGNILHSAGTGRLEVVAPGNAAPVPLRAFPLAIGERSIRIENLDAPLGKLTLRFIGSASNDQFKVSKEMTLAERELIVSGPVEAKRLEGSFPRVLVLRGREGRVVEQAVAETMLQQAFDQEDLFARIVDTPDEFAAHAMTGKFNTYLLYEPQEMPKAGLLKELLAKGQGVILVGATEAARASGEELGFKFRDLPGKAGQVIGFTEKSPLGLTGTIPVSGKILSVSGFGAQAAAHFGASADAAMVVGQAGKGKVVILPLSLSRSAYEDGTLALFSLVLRKAGVYAAPETDTGGVLSGGLSVTSTGAALNARVTETLPPGSRVLWSNQNSTVKGTTIIYQVKADRGQRRLLYLYQPPAAGQTVPSSEVFYECGGKYISQGKVE